MRSKFLVSVLFAGFLAAAGAITLERAEAESRQLQAVVRKIAAIGSAGDGGDAEHPAEALGTGHRAEDAFVHASAAASVPDASGHAQGSHKPEASLLAALASGAEDEHLSAPHDRTGPPMGRARNPKISGHSLTAVRVRQLSHSLRVVFFLDEPVPYVVRRNAVTGRAFIDLANVRIESFDSELNDIADSRLSGIWLIDAGPEAARIELRLGAGEIQIEDFALFEPPAIVLDIFRPGDEYTELPREFERRSSPSTDISHSALPPELLGPSVQIAAPPTPLTSAEPQAADADEKGEILFAMRADFEGFPIDEIHVRSLGASGVLQFFFRRRWGSAFSAGIQYLEHSPGAPDALHVLYLVAESRYQLSRGSNARNSADAQNFYRQALFSAESPGLAAFARRRLAQMKYASGQYLEALYYLDRIPIDTEHPRLAKEVRTERARVIAELRSEDEAIATLREIFPVRDAEWVDFGGATLEGKLLLSSGEPEQAWEAMQIASAIDAEWWQRDIDSAQIFGKTARDMGELDRAIEAYDYAVYSFMRRMNDRPSLFMEYADLLRRYRDRALLEGRHDDAAEYDEEARIWYRRLLHLGRDGEPATPEAREARAQLARYHALAMSEGEASYALYFMGRGEIHDAMEQLITAKRRAVSSGEGGEALAYAAGEILDPYLKWANDRGLWHETLVAWGNFGEFLKAGPARNATRISLAKAMTEVDMNEEALEIVEGLLAQTSYGSGAATDALRIQRAAILNRVGRGVEVIAELEKFAQSESITSARVDAMRALAQVYNHNDLPIQAAQMFEKIGRTNELPSVERGNAWLTAGRLYLDQGLPRQSVEVGLRAIVYEEDQDENTGIKAWDKALSGRLKMMLGRSFFALEEYRRAIVLFEDYLARGGLSGGERGLAHYLLGLSRSYVEDPASARASLSASRRDTDVPKVWRDASAEILARLDYDSAKRFDALFGETNRNSGDRN